MVLFALGVWLAKWAAWAVLTVATASVAAEVRLTFDNPADLDRHIARRPGDIPAIFVALGDALMTSDLAERQALGRYLGRFTRLHAKRERDIRVLVSLQLVDPNRFLSENAFRSRVLEILPRALDGSTSLDIRLACLRELNTVIGLSFDEAERVALGWEVIQRSSAQRQVPFGTELIMPDDLAGPIETSIFSLTSQFFTPADVKRFLAAVRVAAPRRKIVVLADGPMAGALKDIHHVETFSRSYTPWPRDPFTVARGKDGTFVLVNRPNLQPDREEDTNMVRALVQAGPFESRWTIAPMAFHNGHVLLTPTAAWISIHSVEIRALEILALKRVPAETFGTRAGIERYVAAVKQASKELERLYRRPVRFVHPLDSDPALFDRLRGGGGFDLDSMVTMLPQPDGSFTAVVGDIALGMNYEVPRAYGVAGKVLPAEPLRTFLDTVADSLSSRGLTVRRLPLLLVAGEPEPFLITWNNVVLEPGRAEGFASLIVPADALARETFATAGYPLTLYPPLIGSIVLNGGYRCASNHVRPMPPSSLPSPSSERGQSPPSLGDLGSVTLGGSRSDELR